LAVATKKPIRIVTDCERSCTLADPCRDLQLGPGPHPPNACSKVSLRRQPIDQIGHEPLDEVAGRVVDPLDGVERRDLPGSLGSRPPSSALPSGRSSVCVGPVMITEKPRRGVAHRGSFAFVKRRLLRRTPDDRSYRKTKYTRSLAGCRSRQLVQGAPAKPAAPDASPSRLGSDVYPFERFTPDAVRPQRSRRWLTPVASIRAVLRTLLSFFSVIFRAT